MDSNTVDVLVVGAGSAGLYFAGLMAERGLNVHVYDVVTEDKLGTRYDVIHIARKHFAAFDLPEPGPGDASYIRSFTRAVQKSALNNWPKNSYEEIMVLRRAPLMASLLAWARDKGVQVHFESLYEKPLFNTEGKLCGAAFRNVQSGVESNEDNAFEVQARLVVDASGINAVVRTALPDDYGIENFVTGPRDQFYVILRYATLADPEKDKIECNTTWTHYKTWLAPQIEGNGAIIGIGANLSFDYANTLYDRFAAKGFLPEHTVDYVEESSTPYRRPPYTLVADGFIALGDAACITNPWSGEGVPYAWLEGKVITPIAATALAEGAYPTQEALWQANKAYAEAQGALFAKNLSMLVGASQCSEEENDYEYKQGIIYEDHDEQNNSLEKGSLPGKLIKGLLTGNISFGTLKRLMGAASLGDKMEAHYLAFPATPAGFEVWKSQADAYWQQAGSMADVAERDLAGQS